MTAALSWPLQQALYDHLVADAELTSLLGGPHVYDAVPHRDGPSAPSTPYVVFAEESASAWDAQTVRGAEIELTLEVWSRSRGYSEIKQIQARLSDLLDDPELPLDRGTLILLRVASSDSSRAGGGMRRGRLRLKASAADV